VRVLIADDEPVARHVLSELLGEFPAVAIAGEATNGRECVERVSELKPDVVFLDLQMPALDGLAVARALSGSTLPLIVYVTAFEQHALDAFETGAVDYLLKPVRKERLAATLDKVRAHLAGLEPRAAALPPAAEPRRIVGRTGADLHLIDPADVIAFKAEGDTVLIITSQARYYSDHSLRALQEKLPHERFRRIHRSTIINTDHIRRISPLSSKRFMLLLTGGLEAVVSKRMAGIIRDATRW
jgi:DNA-binding LytR/AlgR family response regulator